MGIDKKNRVNEAVSLDKRTVGYKRRKPSMTKGPEAMVALLKAVKNADFRQNAILEEQLDQVLQLQVLGNHGFRTSIEK